MDTLDKSQQRDAQTLLRVDGLVATPRAFAPEDLAALPRIRCTEDFSGGEKETEPAQTWSGPSLLSIIQLAQPKANAKYVRIHAPNFTIPLSLSELEGVLLAESLNGEPLSSERGAPWRLYVPGAKRSISVKWVNRLEVMATRGSTPQERAARARERGLIKD
jgi:DMSO/TMAO reductase YedYZ molybdopterin-dependent catalytic subunit